MIVCGSLPAACVAVVFAQLGVFMSLGFLSLFNQKELLMAEGWCPSTADLSTRIIMLCIAGIYVARLRVASIEFSDACKHMQKTGSHVGKFDSVLGLYLMVDLVVMQGSFEAAVYLFNLYLVFKTPEPLEMVLNMLALEFIVKIDNEFKSAFMKMKRKHIVGRVKQLNNEPPWEGIQAILRYIMKPMMYLMRFSFPVATLSALFACFYGPLCKP